ncbi:MAG: nucleotidyltransferase domain-containing protein [Gammaproteobacteria bacterium]|nr:nucleotidyltransferase domain-containing protein [Gammaproteobacteria bacterium]
MPTLNLDPLYLAEIKKIIKQVAPSATIWAYGSRISGQNHDTSDLDLVLRHSTQLTQSSPELLPLKQAFQNSMLPILIDIADWATLPAHFQKEIERNHVVVCCP